MRDLPGTPFEPCDKCPTKVSSTALVRYRLNDYSVPPPYGFRDVLVKGFVDRWRFSAAPIEIARHPRIYDRGEFVFDPKHYLALLEQKPGALDQAAPLQSWILAGAAPASAATLGSPHGQSRQTRVHPGAAADGGLSRDDRRAAALDAIRLGAISFDAVKQLVIAKVERRPARLDLDDYPYLPVANVKTTSAADYAVLVSGRAA